MSDGTQHPSDPVAGPPEGLAPPPDAPRPGRGRSKLALTAVAGAMVVAAVGFGVVSLTSGSGADSAQGAVEDLFGAIDREDAIGVAESLEPSERAIVLEALEDTEAEAQRVDVAADDLDLRSVEGVDLEVADLRLQTSPLDDDTYAVDITAGTISSRTELAAMPIGPVVQEVLDRNGDDGAHTDEIELAGTRIVAVERDGGWYVSALYSFAELIRRDLEPVPPYPAAGTAIAAVGAESPEAAVREGVAAAAALDVERLIELTPAEEARVLHAYGPILVAEAKDMDSGVEIGELELEVADAPGGRKLVRATSLDMTITTEWDRQVMSYDGECTTSTWEPTDPEELEYYDEGELPSEWTWCDEDLGAMVPFAFYGYFSSPGSLDILVEEHDGRWFLSPTASFFENSIGPLRDLDVDEVRRLARSWGGEWWLTVPDEMWEACGVARPPLDTSAADGEQAYEQCIESLPADYDGPYSSYGGYGGYGSSSSSGGEIVYGEEEAYEFPGMDCYDELDVDDSASMDEVEACLAALVEAGELDPMDLASFRCERLYEEVPNEMGLTDEELDAMWEQIDQAYEACMEEAEQASGGGGPSFSPSDPVQPVPSTTQPPSTATTRPTATTAPPATTVVPSTDASGTKPVG